MILNMYDSQKYNKYKITYTYDTKKYKIVFQKYTCLIRHTPSIWKKVLESCIILYYTKRYDFV